MRPDHARSCVVCGGVWKRLLLFSALRLLCCKIPCTLSVALQIPSLLHTSCHPSSPQVPLDKAVRIQSDDGVPIVVSSPDSPSASAYVQIAHRVWDKLKAAEQQRGAAASGPTITVS